VTTASAEVCAQSRAKENDMFKNRIMQIVIGSFLATALWQAPASAEEKKDEAKTEQKKEEKAAATKTAKKEKKDAPAEEQPKEQK
jgi:hypothetical protein